MTIGNRLVAMLQLLDAITRVLIMYDMDLHAMYDIVFHLRPSLLYMPKSERAVGFLADSHLLGTQNLSTFSCGGFWSCANRDDAWSLAVPR
jgi:hypothetical protein